MLKHQNTKTALYKLLKNHWVIALFELSGPVRNKLLVTVSLDHPVFGECNILNLQIESGACAICGAI